MSMFGFWISPLLIARTTASRIGVMVSTSCISDVRRRCRLRADHLDFLRQLIRDRDRQVVVRDLPLAADLAHHAAAAALAVRRTVELLVEPRHITGGADDHVGLARQESPPFALLA